jgi:hypothetical protein
MGAMPDTMQPAPLPSVYQLRVVVRGVSPLIWRRLLVPADTTIAGLHAVLQIAFGWTGTHLHRFVVQGREYDIGYVGGPSFDADPRKVRLGDLGLRRTERFTYHYDFTAGWCLDLRVEQVVPAVPGRPRPVCTGGRRAGPPEDCGGVRAFLESTQPHHVLAAAIRAAEILASELDKAGSLGRVGGAVYLHTLMATVPTAANAGFYAQIVAEKAILRRLVEAGTRIVQLGYGGNEGEAGGGEVDEIVDRAQAEITGSRSRSLCRVLGGVSLRFGLFTLRPRWGSPGVDPLGVRCARWAVVQRAPAAVHRVAARVRPERWSSPASKTDRSGPVIQHPVRSSRPRRRPTLTTHGDPLPSGTAAQVGAAPLAGTDRTR